MYATSGCKLNLHLCVDAVAATFDDIASRKFGEKFVTFAPNLVAVALCFDWLNFAQTCAVALCVVGEILRLNGRFCGGCGKFGAEIYGGCEEIWW